MILLSYKVLILEPLGIYVAICRIFAHSKNLVTPITNLCIIVKVRRYDTRYIIDVAVLGISVGIYNFFASWNCLVSKSEYAAFLLGIKSRKSPI